MEWIDASKEAPTEWGKHVVWTDKGKWELAAFIENMWCFTQDIYNIENYKVTHWLKISGPNV